MPSVCLSCNREVYSADERIALGKVWHTFCFSCRKCRKLLDSCSVATHCGELFCKNCYSSLFPAARLTSSLPSDSLSPPEITVISKFNSAQTTIQISDSLSDFERYCCTDDEILNENQLPRNDLYEINRLCGGGISEQQESNCVESENTNINNSVKKATCNATSSPNAVTAWYNRQHPNSKNSFNCQRSTKLCRPWTASSIEIQAASRNSNDVNDHEIISTNRSTSHKLKNFFHQTAQLQYSQLKKYQKYPEQNLSSSLEKEERQTQSQNDTRQVKNLDFDKEMNTKQDQISTGEDRTKVILSTCKSCHKSRNVIKPNISSRRKCMCQCSLPTNRNPVPFRRRVSFSDAVVGGNHCRTIMQNDIIKSCRDDDRSDTEGQETLYDIWQADDSAGRSDDGYENISRIDNYSEKRVLICASNKDQDPENIDDLEDQECMQERWGSRSDICSTDHIIDNKTRDISENYLSNKEIHANSNHKDTKTIGPDEYRMRGGCNGCCKTPCEKSLQDHSFKCSGCCRGIAAPNESYPPCEAKSYRDGGKTACTTIAECTSPRCCSKGCQVVCKKMARCALPCTTGARSCGSGGCCGSGCRGGCGKPGQICMPSRACTSPGRRPHSSRGRSPCARSCCPQLPCPPADRISGYSSGCGCCCGGIYECKRSQSPKCRSTIGSGSCINDGTKCCVDVAAVSCCRLKLPTGCECLGGGLDCQRCGRKVYQAEMQIASGVPYHSICFSCFCCRKPLEPLTYQENCGEIYCKQCYVRNFGPQGYGYGVGAGVLQTPL